MLLDIIILSSGLSVGTYGLVRSIIFDKTSLHRKLFYLGVVTTNISALKIILRKHKKI